MKRRWLVLGAAVIATVAWLGVPSLARRMRFFRVRQVEFVGLRFQSAEAALAALALPKTLSVFDDLDAVRARAGRIPGVQAVEVGRRLPGTLIVRVREARPVALVPRQGLLRLMDAMGAILPFDPLRSAPDLPIAAQPSRSIGRLLEAVQAADPALYAKVTAARMRGTDVVLTVDGRQFVFRPDASAEEMRAVMLVAADLTRKGNAFGELDGRFAGYVVVRGGS